MTKEQLRAYMETGQAVRVKVSGATFPAKNIQLPRQAILHQLYPILKENGTIDIRIVPEPDNPFNKGDDIAQMVVLIGEELGELSESLDGVDIGYIPLKGHALALGHCVEEREHYNGTELNYAFRGLELEGVITKIVGNESTVYGAVIEVWTA